MAIFHSYVKLTECIQQRCEMPATTRWLGNSIRSSKRLGSPLFIGNISGEFLDTPSSLLSSRSLHSPLSQHGSNRGAVGAFKAVATALRRSCSAASQSVQGRFHFNGLVQGEVYMKAYTCLSHEVTWMMRLSCRCSLKPVHWSQCFLPWNHENYVFENIWISGI